MAPPWRRIAPCSTLTITLHRPFQITKDLIPGVTVTSVTNKYKEYAALPELKGKVLAKPNIKTQLRRLVFYYVDKTIAEWATNNESEGAIRFAILREGLPQKSDATTATGKHIKVCS